MATEVEQMKKQTEKEFWSEFIRELAADIHGSKEKSFLKTAAKSHCRSYAIITNRSPDNITAAINEFFK